MAKKEIKKEKKPGTSLQGMDALTPGGDLQAYINSVHSIGVLTPEEEKKYYEKKQLEEERENSRLRNISLGRIDESVTIEI